MLIREKVEQAKKILQEFNIDCWITFARETQINGDPMLAFLSPADLTWHSAFIIAKDGRAVAIVGKYDRLTVEETGAYDEVIDFVTGVREPFIDYMKKLNPAEIALNYSVGSEIADGLTYGMFLTMESMLKEMGFEDRVVSAEKLVSALRERKTPSELTAMKAAIAETEAIFELVTDFIRPGRTEKEIAAYMQAEVKKRELGLAWDASVCPAVFTGPDTAAAHYAPTDKKVEPGHILNMDFGVRVDGYCSDMQRTFYIAKAGETEIPEDVVRGFTILRDSIEYSRQAIMPGKFGHEIDKISRETITTAGYEEFPHGLGHQVGRYSHDGTALLGPPWEKYAQKPFQPLEENMVFTIEPRLTVPGKGVVTIEEMVVVTKNGAEYLSKPQTELIVIEP